MTIVNKRLFANPPNAYRPLQIVHGFDSMLTNPAKLTGERGIDRRLAKLAKLGIGGVVGNVSFAHYLQSPRQWDIYRHGMQSAAKKGLVLWWYDEKGYPSGSAGGLVTRSHPEYAALGLACYQVNVRGPRVVRFDMPVSCRSFVWAGAVKDLDKSDEESVLPLGRFVDAQGRLAWRAPAGRWTVLYLADRVMYEGTHSAGNVFEFKHYVNLLDPRATAEFIRVTHDRYHRETPPVIWKKTRAVFTDEPSFMTAYSGKLPSRFDDKIPVVDRPLFEDRPPAVPWADGLLEGFRRARGYELRPRLFELFVSESDEARYTRQDFHEFISGQYAEAFYGQILGWCRAHGIASSGHVMAEEYLVSHVEYHGSLFAAVRNLDLPGIDMLDSNPRNMLAGHGFMAAKQVSSVAHITGAKEVHSESSDWCQWNDGHGATLAERMGQGNLQYVLGINQITSYFGWKEIGDAGCRAYNDYMGRLALFLRGGRHVCDVALLYPIRSAWLNYVPRSPLPEFQIDAGHLRKRLDGVSCAYADLTRNLLRQQIDLDILDEQAVTDAKVRNGVLRMADEAYRVVVLPPLDAMSVPVARKLVAFARAGGTVVSVGSLPKWSNSPANTKTLRRLMSVLFGSKGTGQMVPEKELAAYLRGHGADDFVLGRPNADILYTHRRFKGRDLYFVINCSPKKAVIKSRFRAPGPFILYRPLTGRIEAVGVGSALTLKGYEGILLQATK